MLRRLIQQLRSRRPGPGTGMAKGNALVASGDLDDTIEVCRAAVARDGSNPATHNELGIALQRAGMHADAAQCFRAALALAPEETAVRNNLGTALRHLGDLDGAAREYEAAAAMAPHDPLTRFNRAVLAQKLGLADEAVPVLRELVRERPLQSEFGMALAQALNYSSGFDDPAVTAHIGAAAAALVGDVDTLPRPAARTPGPLRIGYLSPDFRNHPVLRFMEPILAAHDPAAVTVFCYDDTQRPDAWTRRLDALALEHCRVAGMSDAAVAERIAGDAIDLLVDLAGLTTGGRPGVIARRPARVQVSYLGYLNTTGLAAMDWRITDNVADPPGSAECYYTERLAYLPACQWLFTPPEEAPACTVPPSERNGYVTLGAAHNFAKMTPAVLELWSGAAAAVPQCRIALLGVPEGSARARVTGAFARAGIGADRITCSAGMSRPDYYRFLSSLDVALDTFPYAGGTTTCDALWMGIPVVSLAGRHGASRSGASLLSATRLGQCVAGSHEEYVSICARLCADLTGLARMRASMRERMAASPLMDVRGFVRGLEGLYRAMAQS